MAIKLDRRQKMLAGGAAGAVLLALLVRGRGGKTDPAVAAAQTAGASAGNYPTFADGGVGTSFPSEDFGQTFVPGPQGPAGPAGPQGPRGKPGKTVHHCPKGFHWDPQRHKCVRNQRLSGPRRQAQAEPRLARASAQGEPAPQAASAPVDQIRHRPSPVRARRLHR